jgi:hypothetical protein
MHRDRRLGSKTWFPSTVHVYMDTNIRHVQFQLLMRLPRHSDKTEVIPSVKCWGNFRCGYGDSYSVAGHSGSAYFPAEQRGTC